MAAPVGAGDEAGIGDVGADPVVRLALRAGGAVVGKRQLVVVHLEKAAGRDPQPAQPGQPLALEIALQKGVE